MNSGSIHDPIRGRIHRLAEIQSKSDRLLGAKIIAQENTRRYLSQVQRVEDWDYNFLALAPGGIPSEVFGRERSLKLNGSTIALKSYSPAHTDSDISVTFTDSNVVHVGDTFWNGIYPFIDYST